LYYVVLRIQTHVCHVFSWSGKINRWNIPKILGASLASAWNHAQSGESSPAMAELFRLVNYNWPICIYVNIYLYIYMIMNI
jgi:hypothetical protein